jgi:hypothetical protein
MPDRRTLHVAADELANAIMCAIREHGQPNAFSPGELARLYGGPSPLLAGRIGRDADLLQALRRLTCQPGLLYHARQFHVPTEGP